MSAEPLRPISWRGEPLSSECWDGAQVSEHLQGESPIAIQRLKQEYYCALYQLLGPYNSRTCQDSCYVEMLIPWYHLNTAAISKLTLQKCILLQNCSNRTASRSFFLSLVHFCNSFMVQLYRLTDWLVDRGRGEELLGRLTMGPKYGWFYPLWPFWWALQARPRILFKVSVNHQIINMII